MENKKLTPSEVLEDILDIHMHHTEYDDEDPDYPIQWDQDDGSIAENYPNEAAVLRMAVKAFEIIRRYGLHACWKMLVDYNSYEAYKKTNPLINAPTKEEYVLLKKMYKNNQ